MRGNSSSAAPNPLWPGKRLLNEPSTVRRPKGTNEFGIKLVRSAPAACCFRDENLLQDEIEIGPDVRDHGFLPVGALPEPANNSP